MPKVKKSTKKKYIGIILILLLIIILGFLIFPFHHIFPSKTLAPTISVSPSRDVSPWDTPTNQWKTYEDSRIRFLYPQTMYTNITTTEPNLVSGKNDALIVDITRDATPHVSFRIEPIYQSETIEDWLVARKERQAITCPTCKQFIYPSYPFTFDNIQGRKDHLTGMMGGDYFYFLLGNNIIWLNLGYNNNADQENTIIKNFEKISLQIK